MYIASLSTKTKTLSSSLPKSFKIMIPKDINQPGFIVPSFNTNSLLNFANKNKKLISAKYLAYSGAEGNEFKE